MSRVAILVLFGFIGCGCSTTTLRLDCDEACAIHDMACSGQSIQSTESSKTRQWRYGDGAAYAVTPETVSESTKALTFHCIKDPAKLAEISKIKESVFELERDRKFSILCSGLSSHLLSSVQKQCKAWKEEAASRPESP